ncbi:MAG: DUF4082 domain-containing protein [Geodermatophilaceae bacterium]|nr:DUF4082 domain-containing protein [Geodermatophilaceae bacterium]
MSPQQSYPSSSTFGYRRPRGRHGHRVAFAMTSGVALLIATVLLFAGLVGNPVSAAGEADSVPQATSAELPARLDTVFGAAKPTSNARHRNASIELGLRFSARADGVILGLRIYRPAGHTDPQTATLWTGGGTRLAGLTMPATTKAGWLYVSLPSPVTVERDTEYVASYHTADGRVSDPNYFSTGDSPRGLLTPAMVGDEVDPHNGVFRYGAGTGFPTRSYRSTNYWVDVAFVATRGPTATTEPTESTTQSTGPSVPRCLYTCPPSSTPPTSTPTVTTDWPSPTPTCLSCPPPTPPTLTTDP